MQNTISEKPTLAQLLNRHHLTMPRLALAARISLHTVRAMVQQHPMRHNVAQQVLSGLFRLTGVCYRLEDVNVALISPVYEIGSTQVRREDLEACHTSMKNEDSRRA